MALPKVEIRLAKNAGECSVKIDGVEMQGVRGVVIEKVDINAIPFISLGFLSNDVTIESAESAELAEVTAFGDNQKRYELIEGTDETA